MGQYADWERDDTKICQMDFQSMYSSASTLWA